MQSVESLCARHDVDMAHAWQVARIANQLFDELRALGIHGLLSLTPRDHEMLETSALLHDIAIHTDGPNPHLAGRDIVMAAPLDGFLPVERMMLACVITFGGDITQPTHEPLYKALDPDRKRVTLLFSALVRIADGLDASHTQTTEVASVRREAQAESDNTSDADSSSPAVHVQLRGPHSRNDAAQASARADLWRSLIGDIRFNSFTASLGLSMDDTLAEAGCKVLRYRFDWVGGQAAWKIVSPEGVTPQRVSKLRVAARRMRNDLRIFESGYRDKVIRPTIKGLRTVSSAVRPLRMHDALLANLNDYAERCDDEAKAGLTPLMVHWRERRAEAGTDLLALMASDAYQDWLECLEALVSHTNANSRVARKIEPGEPSRVRHIAQTVVWQHLSDVRAFDTLPDPPQATHLHALRLAIKRLRYTLEVLPEVLPVEETQLLMRNCIAAQDAYGAINDAHVASTHALQFVSHQRNEPRRSAHARASISRVALKGIVTYAEAQQKVVEARLAVWRDLLQPFL